MDIRRCTVLNEKPAALKQINPIGRSKKHSVVISLSEIDYRHASLAAKSTKQTVAAWIADMVYTSTQP